MKRSNHIPASILARLYLVLCLLAVLPLGTSTALAQGAKKVPFPFSPIGLNCLPWFVAKDARLFEKHAIDFDPVFIGASSALFNAMLSGAADEQSCRSQNGGGDTFNGLLRQSLRG
jgi:ABC-type nitrate/sulfonate/bicarbonate transport system substrate-binding protein